MDGMSGFWNLADALESPDGQVESTRLGTVSRIESDGMVYVRFAGSDIDMPVHSRTVEVSPGDAVNVTIEDGRAEVLGNYTDPSAGVQYVRAVEGIATEAGATAHEAVDSAAAARQVADEANKVAQATNQHFFADTNGAHITDVTQDEWAAAVADNFSDYDPTTKPYHNQLLNSLGILLRTALNNLVSITRSAIAFYDGTGNAASNIVARFGSAGAQIGKADSSHIELGADSMSIVNEDGATMFDVDMDAGVFNANVDTPTGKYSHTPNRQVSTLGETTISYTHTSAEIDLTAGETFTIAANQTLCELVTNPNTGDIITLLKPTITATSGLSYTGSYSDINPYVFKNTSAMSFTYGTASSYTMTANGSFDQTTTSHGRYKYTIALNITLDYGGGSSFDVVQSLTLDIDSLGTDNGPINVGETTYLPSARYYRSTTGAALTFGTRQEGSTDGLLSATFGEGLIASSEKQSVFGAYNEEDANGDYALIIGNGTADNARSNAAAITWLGEYIAQGWAGIIQMFGGSTPPAGWLLCDGAAVSRTEYAVLFAAIGTTWGAGDGSTTFNLPDLRGRAPIGAGTGSGLTARTLGGKLGSENIQAHTHSFTQPTITAKYSNDNTVGGSGRRYVQSGTQSSTTLATASGGAVGAVSDASTGNAGNMQPSAVVNFIIHTGKTS